MRSLIRDLPVSVSAASPYEDQPVSIRAKLSALWISMLFIFAYVDLFSLYREDFRAEIASGSIAGFEIGQTFLLFTTVYIAIPSLMVFATLVLRPGLNRILSIGVSALYALTILGSAIGEWNYFIFGSALEIILLGTITYCAWTWPKSPAETTPAPNSIGENTPRRSTP